ncbi:DUF6279 family lipoprotein [Massilia sp. GCM10020059]|uniref:DUF6279 family lipoprotein n=1 Tax=Massilia agrisoli TaxID=2892444 RepID=A0ABS8IQZ4_9BURK|nr:DUF6279 family lipoprotein [Massilia agrisoli]MCC6070316.1 DUF6279 family lipoprotein [Massilia agrisoli]
MKKFNTQDTLFHRIRLLCVIAVMLTVAACSSVRFTYNNGDTLLYYWLNAYVDIDTDQSDWVKKDIDDLFQWHRSTQLKDYVQLLQKGQRQLAGNLTQADLLADYREIRARSEKLANKAVPDLAELAISLKPDQINTLARKFESNNDKYRKKFLRGGTEERNKVRFKKAMEQFDLWFGDFSRQQEAALRKASDARPLDNEVWLDERMRRQQMILALLRKVHDQKLSREATIPLVQQLVRDVFARMDSPERKAFYDASIDGTTKMILTAVKIATPEQKAHAHKRMQGWIDDFNVLAAAKQE